MKLKILQKVKVKPQEKNFVGRINKALQENNNFDLLIVFRELLRSLDESKIAYKMGISKDNLIQLLMPENNHLLSWQTINKLFQVCDYQLFVNEQESKFKPIFLAHKDPKLFKELMMDRFPDERNPYRIKYTSPMKVWWKCMRNHTWQETIRNRHIKQMTCPYCK